MQCQGFDHRRCVDRAPGFDRVINIYLPFGAQSDAEALIGQIRSLYEERGISSAFSVTASVTGSGPDFQVIAPARDVADSYAENTRMTDQLGEDLQSLNARMGALARRIEIEHRTPRRHLYYQPSN